MCFFYGLKPSEVMSLDIETDHILWHSITVIEAQEMLKTINAVSYPNMKENARNKLHKKLYREAYPATFRESIQLTPDVLARALRG